MKPSKNKSKSKLKNMPTLQALQCDLTGYVNKLTFDLVNAINNDNVIFNDLGREWMDAHPKVLSYCRRHRNHRRNVYSLWALK
jgi:hypothetical protein